jgi:hypothetical protein
MLSSADRAWLIASSAFCCSTAIRLAFVRDRSRSTDRVCSAWCLRAVASCASSSDSMIWLREKIS